MDAIDFNNLSPERQALIEQLGTPQQKEQLRQALESRLLKRRPAEGFAPKPVAPEELSAEDTAQAFGEQLAQDPTLAPLSKPEAAVLPPKALEAAPPLTAADFAGDQRVEDGYEDQFTDAPLLTAEDYDTTVVDYNGKKVPYKQIREAAAKHGVHPEAILYRGTAAGRFEAGLGTVPTGQFLQRAGIGIVDVVTAGLDLASRAGVPGIDREKLQRNKRIQHDFLDLIDREGGIEAQFGESANRIFNSASESIGKVGAAGVGGTVAVYAAIGGDVYDNSLISAEEQGLKGIDAHIYAGKQAAAELGTMAIMGQVARGMGLRTLEESFGRGVTPTVSRLSSKLGLKDTAAKVASLAAGAGIEAGEESITEVIQQAIDVNEGFREDFDFASILEAGATGAIAAGAVQTTQAMQEKMQNAGPMIEQTLQAAEDAQAKLADMPAAEVEDILERSVEELMPLPGVKDLDFLVEGVKRSEAEGKALKERLEEGVSPERAFPPEIAAERKSRAEAAFKEAAGLPEDASADYVEEYLAQFEDRRAQDIQTKEIAEEVTDSDVSDSGIPIPENRGAIDALESYMVNTLTTGEQALNDFDAPQVEAPTEEGLSARHVDLEAFSKRMGLDSYFSPGVRSRALVQAEAVKLGIPEKALSLATATLTEGKILSDTEQTGLVMKLAELEGRASTLARRIVETQDTAEIFTMGAELNRLSGEAQQITDAVALTGTRLGQALVHRKIQAARDYSPTSVLARAKTAKKANLTAEETAAYNKMSGEFASVEAKTLAKESELKDSQAMKLMNDSIAEGNVPSGDSVAGLYSRVRQLLDGGCDF